MKGNAILRIVAAWVAVPVLVVVALLVAGASLHLVFDAAFRYGPDGPDMKSSVAILISGGGIWFGSITMIASLFIRAGAENNRHMEAMTALEALIERTAPQTGTGGRAAPLDAEHDAGADCGGHPDRRVR